MKMILEIPDYDGNGIDVIWERGAKLVLDIDENGFSVSANAAGLISLAKEMLYLANNDFPDGAHVHYDNFFTGQSLQYELIIEKMST